MKKYLNGFIFLVLLLCIGCKKEITKTTIYDDTVFLLNDKVVYQTASEKTKQKSSTQFISILYADLFATSISAEELYDLGQMTLSCGDKQLMNNMIVDNYINDMGASIPSDASMRGDIELFVTQTYVRFFLRNPTAYELYFLKNVIMNDASMTPNLVYQAFASSNEYLFY